VYKNSALDDVHRPELRCQWPRGQNAGEGEGRQVASAGKAFIRPFSRQMREDNSPQAAAAASNGGGFQRIPACRTQRS